MSRNCFNFHQLLHDDFQQAHTKVKSLTNLDNKTHLELYGYFQQATIGDITITKKPFFFQFNSKAKWTAWNKCKGMPKEIAQVKYIKLVYKLT